MSRPVPNLNLMNNAMGSYQSIQTRLQQGWSQRSTGLRSPLVQGALAAVVIAGLLLAIHQVVHGAVQQSTLRQQASAAQAAATRRCNALRSQPAGERCREQLAAAGGSVSPPSQSQ